MPYQSGRNLPAERDSRLRHLDIVKSALATLLIRSFEDSDPDVIPSPLFWQEPPSLERPLRLSFSVDSSFQPVMLDSRRPYRRLGFVKTALLRTNLPVLNRVNKAADFTHPKDLQLGQTAPFEIIVDTSTAKEITSTSLNVHSNQYD